MADVNANIHVNIDTSSALAQLKNLQRQLATFHSSVAQGSAAAATAQKNLQTNLLNSINSTGMFTARMGLVRTSTESFTHALENNKLTMREYFRYAGGSTKTFGKLFKSEFDTIGKVAQERVKKMQTQYIKMGRDASGAMKSMSITPTTLNMKDYATQTAIAAQKQAIFNKLMKQGSTNLLNFGKNTQWAGRQLMVGFSVPLAYIGTFASKTFMELEAQAIRFKRVYGDMFTTKGETDRALADIQKLAEGFTKYGVAVVDTMKMAADAAAMGKTGADLAAQVSEATRLAVLGGVEQQKALETTISLTNAFGTAAEDLKNNIDFLNAVENQTVVNIEDLTTAIPKAGPVVKQLGGDVKDLAFFLTAMKEGGINASEGANALKSGLASLINPSKKASAMLGDMGINIKGIVEANAGNLKETVVQFAQALDALDPLSRARAIEQLFGKFQFARLSTLFQNITKDGTQASRVLGLAGASVTELAILSERELKTLEDAVGTNFKEAVQQLKISLAPIGKTFLQAITPLVKTIGDLFSKFNNLGDGTKKFIVVATTLVGVVGPVLLMTFGLFANGLANIIKLFIALRSGFMRIGSNTTVLAEQTTYLNAAQLESATVAASLNQAHTRLTQKFEMEAAAVNALRTAYIQATTAGAKFALANPGMIVGGLKKGAKTTPKKYAKGITTVPGSGTGDTVSALLTPGEGVVPVNVMKNPDAQVLLQGMINGSIFKYGSGTTKAGSTSSKLEKGDAFAHVGTAEKISAEDYIKNTPGLTEYDKARIRNADAIGKASGVQGHVTDYKSLGFAFNKELNSGLVNGIDYEKFKKEWIAKGPEKWDVRFDRTTEKGLYGPDNKIIDDAMFAKITEISKGKKVTDAMIKQAFKELPQDIKQTATYQNMSKAFTTRSQYGIGKGLSHSPTIMEAKFKKAIDAGSISNKPIIKIDGDLTEYNGKKVPLDENGKQRKLSSVIGNHPDFPLPANSHVIITRKNNTKAAAIYAYDEGLGRAVFLAKGASTKRDRIGLNPELKLIDAATNKKILTTEQKQKNDKAMQLIDKDFQQSSMSKNKPTSYGKQVAPSSGFSFPVGSVGGVYQKSDGTKVFVKPMIDEKSAKAELRADEIARKAHGLTTPRKQMRVMIDPTDASGNRKLIVLESPFSPKFSESKMTGKFTEEQYFKQLVASTLRGDKDLKRGNLSGDILADPGAAGVFDRASGKRDYSTKMLSMFDQAAVNLLGVKGGRGLSKDFAMATLDIPKGMSADQYHNRMIAEINSVIPRLKETLRSMPMTDPAEARAYREMYRRLIKGKYTNWREIHKMHSSVLVQNGEVAQDDKTGKISPLKKKRKSRALEPAKKGKGSSKDVYSTTVPKGASVRKQPLKVRNHAEAPLTQAEQIRIRASQDNVSNSTARRRLTAEGTLISGINKQSAALENNNKTLKLNSEAVKKHYTSLNTGVGALTGLTLAASFAGGSVGDMAQQIMPFMFGIQAVTMLLPLLMNPLIGIPVALAAVAGGLWFYKKKQDDAIKQQARLVGEIYATTKQMQKVGELTNKIGASQIMQTNRERSQGDFSFNRKNTSEGSNFLKSDIGKADLTAFEKRFKIMPDIAIKEFSLKLASYVADGVLSAAQAASIADQVGIEFKNQTIGLKINGQLQSLITLDGKDLTKEPFDIRVNIAKETIDQFNNLLPNVQAQLLNAEKEAKATKEKALIAATDLTNYKITDEEYMSIVKVANEAANKVKLLKDTIKQNSAYAAGMSAQSYESIQAQIDGIEVVATKNIESLEAQKAATKDLEKQALIEQQIKSIQDKKASSIAKLKNMNNQVTASIEQQLKLADVTQKYQYFTGSAEVIKTRFKDTKQEQDANLLLAKTGQMKQTVIRAKIEAAVGSGQLPPAQATSFIDLFSSDQKQLDKVFNAYLTGPGLDGLNKLQSVFGDFADKELVKKIIISMGGLNNKDFQAQYSTLSLLKQLDGEEINMEIAIKNAPNLVSDLTVINSAIENTPDITEKNIKFILENVSLSTGTGFDKAGIDGISKEWEYFSKLPKEERKTAIQTYVSLYNTIFSSKEARETWAYNLALEKAEGVGASAKDFVTTHYYNSIITTTGDLTNLGKEELAKKAIEDTKNIVAYQEAINQVINGNTPVSSSGSKGLSDLSKKVIKGLQAEIKLLEAKQKALQDINDEIDRQYEFQQRQQQLDADMVQAKISGNYIQAALLGQQKLFEQSQFNRETQNLSLEKQIQKLKDRVDAIEGGAKITALDKRIAKIEDRVKNPSSATTDEPTNAAARAAAQRAEAAKTAAAAAKSAARAAADAAAVAAAKGVSGKYVGSQFVVNKAMGGYIKHYGVGSTGGVKGPGTATSDSIPAMLSNGEYVIKASSVNKYGTGVMDALNAGKFAKGGMVGGAPHDLGMRSMGSKSTNLKENRATSLFDKRIWEKTANFFSLPQMGKTALDLAKYGGTTQMMMARLLGQDMKSSLGDNAMTALNVIPIPVGKVLKPLLKLVPNSLKKMFTKNGIGKKVISKDPEVQSSIDSGMKWNNVRAKELSEIEAANPDFLKLFNLQEEVRIESFNMQQAGKHSPEGPLAKKLYGSDPTPESELFNKYSANNSPYWEYKSQKYLYQAELDKLTRAQKFNITPTEVAALRNYLEKPLYGHLSSLKDPIEKLVQRYEIPKGMVSYRALSDIDLEAISGLNIGESFIAPTVRSITNDRDTAAKIAAFGGTGGDKTRSLAKIIFGSGVKGIDDISKFGENQGLIHEGLIANNTKFILEAINKRSSLASRFENQAGIHQINNVQGRGNIITQSIDEYILRAVKMKKGGMVGGAPHDLGMRSFGSSKEKKPSLLSKIVHTAMKMIDPFKAGKHSLGYEFLGGKEIANVFSGTGTKTDYLSAALAPLGIGKVGKAASVASKFGEPDARVIKEFAARPRLLADAMAHVLHKENFGSDAGEFYRALSDHDMAAIAGYTRVLNPNLKFGKEYMQKFADAYPGYADMTSESAWSPLARRWKPEVESGKVIPKGNPSLGTEAALPWMELDPALKVGESWIPDVVKSITKELNFAKSIAVQGGTSGGQNKAIAKIVVDPMVKGLADFRRLLPGHNASYKVPEYTEGAIAPFTRYILQGIKKNAHNFTDEKNGVSHLIDEYIFKAVQTSPYAQFLGRNLPIKTGKHSWEQLLPIVKKAKGGMAKPTYNLPSFDVGTSYVPQDMIAQIHKGERIIPAEENKNFSASGPTTNIININGSDLNKKEIAQAVMVELDRVQKKNNKSNKVVQ